MIIELFGPPGVGKTTIANELVARLQASGHAAHLVQSFRPAEVDPVRGRRRPGRSLAALRRVARPLREVVGAACHVLAGPHPSTAAAKAMRILPPKSLIWSIRLHQYLLRLARSWDHAAMSSDIVIFDQAFVQAVCSLAVLSGLSDRELLARALVALPAADLLVELGAPLPILEARLVERRLLQGSLERLLEFDVATNLQFVPLVESCAAILAGQKRHLVRLECRDMASLCVSVDAIGRELSTQREQPRVHAETGAV